MTQAEFLGRSLLGQFRVTRIVAGRHSSDQRSQQTGSCCVFPYSVKVSHFSCWQYAVEHFPSDGC